MKKILNKKNVIIIGVNIVLLVFVAVALVIFGLQNKTENTSKIIEVSQKAENEVLQEPILVELEDVETIDELEKIDELIE